MDYQRVALYFYSGTGNSYRVASWMADAARAAGAEVSLRPISPDVPSLGSPNSSSALLGLVMPTHGFTMPWAMLRFALRLPRCRRGRDRDVAHTDAIVVATRAGGRIGPILTPGVEGSTTLLAALILAFKGYRIRGATGLDMPSNWIALHPGMIPATVEQIKARAKERTDQFIGAILAGRRRFTGWIPLLIGLWFFPVSLGYLLIGRIFLSKLLFASHRCTGCGLCAAHCPNDAIRMRGREGRRRPYWTFRCESCMRCIAYCPTQAVEASHPLAAGVYLLAAAVPTAAWLTGVSALLPALAVLAHLPRWAWVTIYAIGILGAVYPLFHAMLGVRWINQLCTMTTLTHYYRRYHEPETKLRDLG
jgi:formate hydrogenlyase subunit 6/NADH:ubiquinone oxidoreductase subunit I